MGGKPDGESLKRRRSPDASAGRVRGRRGNDGADSDGTDVAGDRYIPDDCLRLPGNCSVARRRNGNDLDDR